MISLEFLGPHATLFSSFLGLLSPVEALFVLMHTLSSDTRVIYVMTICFFDFFDDDFDGMNGFFDEEDSYYQWAMELREKLSQVSYTLEDSEFLASVRALFPNLDDLDFDVIANHYGWSEVDDRRQQVITEQVVAPYHFEKIAREMGVPVAQIQEQFVQIQEQIVASGNT